MEITVGSCAGFERGRRYGFESKRISGSESTTESSESSSSGGESSCDSFAEGRVAVGIASSPPLLGWPLRKAPSSKSSGGDGSGGKKKFTHFCGPKMKRTGTEISDMDLMKERIAKLLLGEDMSGSGKGVCPALAISNAITNLSVTILGQLWRLEPLPSEKKSMWRSEMECLLCVSDHIVELVPSFQTFPDGSKLEVMTCRQRSDLFIGLPALRKLNNMLLEILDSFGETEFWYVDQGIITPEANGSASFHKEMNHRKEDDKWWLPLPRVPPNGLSENSRKRLNYTRDFTNQILKASMAINSIALAEMQVPESYLDSLPKSGKSCLGDVLYRQITSDRFSADLVFGLLDLSSEHVVLDIVNRVEASIYVWRGSRTTSKLSITPYRPASKSSWELVKGRIRDSEKRELLANRAQSLLLYLKQCFPGLRQTALDTSKIQYNKDVGKSILESYSRVLESLAYNIVIRIDELLYVNDLTTNSDNLHKKVSNPYSVSLLGTPYRTPSFSTPSFSPVPFISPATGERTPFLSGKNNKERYGRGVRKVLANYLGGDSKSKLCIKSS